MRFLSFEIEAFAWYKFWDLRISAAFNYSMGDCKVMPSESGGLFRSKPAS